MLHRPRRLLSIAHSYVVALNRRLAHELARAGGDDWEVTAVAPSFFHGDLRPTALESAVGERCRLKSVSAYFSKHVHVMLYGKRLRRILREPWDLVHCWEEPFILSGGQAAWWKPPGSALVYATFQNIPKRYPPPFCWIERYALDRADGWIAFGQTAERTLAQNDLYSKKTRRMIPLGVDVERFRPDAVAGNNVRRQLGWTPGGPPVVGFLGRFVPEKGLHLLTRVLEQVRVPWRALFVGVGPLEKHLRAWGAVRPDHVRVVTDVMHDRVPDYLNAMDLLCAPSQTTPRWREQLGRMLLEAFACGVPVIASDSGEMPHVVADAGLIVPEKNERQWAVKLSELLENAECRAELKGRGLERARAVYAWPIIARRHLDFFAELLDRPR